MQQFNREKNNCQSNFSSQSSPKIFSAGLDMMELYKPDPIRLEDYYFTIQELWIKLFGANFPTAAAINVIKKNLKSNCTYLHVEGTYLHVEGTYLHVEGTYLHVSSKHAQMLGIEFYACSTHANIEKCFARSKILVICFTVILLLNEEFLRSIGCLTGCCFYFLEDVERICPRIKRFFQK